MNPIGADGKPSKCHICSSTMHWARNCPHSDWEDTVSLPCHESQSSGESVYDANLVLLNLEECKTNESSLLEQTVGSAILDSGCAKSVCGSIWYQCYLDTLPKHVASTLRPAKSESVFRFGNGSEIKSKFQVTLPCRLAGKDVGISADVIDSDIPLLISKKAMKKAQCLLDFKKDEVRIFGKSVGLQCTSSGHYFIPPGLLPGGRLQIRRHLPSPKFQLHVYSSPLSLTCETAKLMGIHPFHW